MPRKHRRYPPEYRREIVGLVHSGQTLEALAWAFEPSVSTARKWSSWPIGANEKGSVYFPRVRSQKPLFWKA